MNESAVESSIHASSLKDRPIDTEFPPTVFIPNVFPPDHLPPGIPMPSVALIRTLNQNPSGSSLDTFRLERRIDGESELVYPVIPEGPENVPMYTAIDDNECVSRYEFIPSEHLAETLRAYAQVTAMITGGADHGLEAARVLQAVAIHDQIPADKKEALGEVLQKDFGIPMLPSIYAKSLERLDDAIQSNDSATKAVRFMHSHNMSTPLEVARAEIAKNPGLLLTYLIRAVAHWSRAKGIENYVPVVDQLQQTVESAMEANLGQLKARHDFMYANINAAMSLFSDLVASKRYPGLYALAEEVTRDALHIPREIRYNTRYLTSLFHQLLTKNEIVSGDDLDSGHVIIRANVKTPSSLLSKALIDPLVYESITGAIKNIDPSAHLPLESSPRFVRAISALDALQCIRANALQSSDTGDKDIFSGIEAQVRIAMIAQDDIIRSRIDFRDSNGLNQAMLKIKDIFRSVQVENISKKKARAEVFAATYGKDGNTAQCYPLDGSQGQDAVGENVAGWITDFVTSLPVPRSFYAAIHAYLPLQYKDGALYIMKNVSEKQRESAGGEMQMTLQAIRPACNLSRRFYDIWAKVAGSLRLDWGLIQKVQKEACIKLKSQTA